ncbi:MAG: twin-arginine translocase TatA/TatE family subunit [Candidatus Dormiibacterota bacterium]
MFGIDRWWLILLVLLVALVVFGPKRLPELGQALGRAINEFRHATQSFEDEVRSGGSQSRPGTSSPPEDPDKPRETVDAASSAPASHSDSAG